jgi:hypothetical protein
MVDNAGLSAVGAAFFHFTRVKLPSSLPMLLL